MTTFAHAARRATVGALALVLPVVVLGALLAGCGGGPSAAGVAHIGKTTTTAVGGGAATTTPIPPADAAKHYADALKLSECMRAHGISNFPDPNSSGGIQISGGGPGSGLDPNSPQFAAAQKACQKYFPTPSPAQQQQGEKQALEFAACMRAHGVPNFPDPIFPGGGRVEERIPQGSGIDPNSPQFQAASTKCGRGPVTAGG
jgi:hypothetical protein